jgi:hypothetical protein
MARLEVEMLGHGEHTDRADTGGEIAVDVLDAETGVVECATRAFRVDLIGGLPRRPTRGMFVHTRDYRLAVKALHRRCCTRLPQRRAHPTVVRKRDIPFRSVARPSIRAAWRLSRPHNLVKIS